MKHLNHLLLAAFAFSLSPILSGEEFIIEGSEFGGIEIPREFSAGDRLIFRGLIEGDEGSPLFLPTPFGGAEFIFDETSRVTGDYRGAIDILSSMYDRGDSEESRSETMTGPSMFSFAGEIASMWGYGIEHYGDFNGSMVQSGLIQTGYNGIRFSGDYLGAFENSGTITSYEDSALYFEGQFEGPFTNSGTLSSGSSNVVYFDDLFTGDFLNTRTIKANAYLDRPLDHDSEEGEGRRVLFEPAPKGDFDGEDDDRDEPAAVNFRGVFTGNFKNTGTIEGNGGVNFGHGLNGSFINEGKIQSSSRFGVQFGDDFEGTFTNSGTIGRLPTPDFPPFPGDMESDEPILREDIVFSPLFGPEEPVEFGVLFDGDFTGDFTNSGTIEADIVAAAFFYDFNGTFQNRGTIEAEYTGILFDGLYDGDFTNTGTISAIDPIEEEMPFPPEEEGMEMYEIIEPSLDLYFPGPRAAVSFYGDFDGDFLNTGNISGHDAGVYFGSTFEGQFENSGTIRGVNDTGIGVAFESKASGTLVNSNLILGGFRGVSFFDGFNGSFQNSGRITASEDSAVYFSQFDGELVNTGLIDSVKGTAIAADAASGTIRNRGGRISGATHAIKLGQGDATVVISGNSRIDGIIDGGDGMNDIIRFENIKGLSAEKRDELAALAAADSNGNSSITLFGETISWTAFEDVQIKLESIESFEEILSASGLELGLGQYGAALDNVVGLNDEIRVFLNALSELGESELKQAAANASGQNVAAAADNYVRSQGSEVFSLFSADFSSLRAGGGSNSGVASNERNGLFTREIQVGVTVNEPIDESHAFITGYMGRGTQDPDENRTESTIDSTSIMFGRSEALSDQWRVGLWGGYTANDVNVDGFGSTLESEAGLVGASVQYQGDYGFSNLVVGYGLHNQTNIRRDFLGNQMNGDTDGHQGLVHGQFGRDFYFGEESRLQVSPYLGFALSRLKMGAYTEEGPTAAALRFGSQTIDSAQSAVGINVSQHYETRKGWLKPKVDAVWWHEFAEADSLGVSLAAPGLINPFQVDSEVANRNRAVVQIGMEMGFDQWENITFDASYFGTYGEDGYTAHGGALSAEFRF